MFGAVGRIVMALLASATDLPSPVDGVTLPPLWFTRDCGREAVSKLLDWP